MLFSRSVWLIAAVFGLAACSSGMEIKTETAAVKAPVSEGRHIGARTSRHCLMRALYFQSIRSSREGLLAVGTVVMNRVESPKFPNTVCAVVGQRKQFAPGVMTRKVRGKTADLERLADSILAGKRHPGVKRAKFFHTAGLTFPYTNMHYVLEAGGNAFYEKRSRKRRKRK